MTADKAEGVEALEYRVDVLERWQDVVKDENLAMVFAIAEERGFHTANDVKEMKADLRTLMELSQQSIGFASKSKTILTVGLVSLILVGTFLLNVYVTVRGG